MNENRIFEMIENRMDRMEQKLDLLLSFRMALITGAAVVSAIVSMFASYLLK